VNLRLHIDSISLDPGLRLTRPERDALTGAVAREIGLRLGALGSLAGSATGSPSSAPAPRPLSPASRARVDRLGADIADAVHAALAPVPTPAAQALPTAAVLPDAARTLPSAGVAGSPR
jgi:hypothetical protein